MAGDGQRKGLATREALMNAGFKVFAEKGFLRTQISDVVREAGKSNGVFHIYFKNKDALLDAWLDRCDAMVPWYQADTSLLFEKARSFIVLSYWSLYERFGPILEALEAAALVSDHFQRRLADLRQKGDDASAKMICHAQSEGRFRGIDPELASISIAAVISRSTAYWFSNRAELEARGFGQAAALAHLDTLYRRMLEGTEATRTDDATRDLIGTLRGSP